MPARHVLVDLDKFLVDPLGLGEPGDRNAPGLQGRAEGVAPQTRQGASLTSGLRDLSIASMCRKATSYPAALTLIPWTKMIVMGPSPDEFEQVMRWALMANLLGRLLGTGKTAR
jgi:hypothetical protein